MCYLRPYELCFYISLIFVLCTSVSVLSDQINSDDEYGESDQSLDDSINLIDTFGDELLDYTQENSTKDENILQIWAKMATDLSDKLWDKLLPIVVRSNNKDTNITHECAGSLFKILMSARKQETWAIKFIDSLGKPSSGVLEGTVASLGDLNECTDIYVETDDYDEGFHGKYCLLYLRTQLPPKPTAIRFNDIVFNISGTEAVGTVFEYISQISASIHSIDAFRFGICLPSNCQDWEIKPILNRIFKRYRIRTELSQKCLSKYNDKQLTQHQIVSIAVISSMALLVSIATLYHWIFGSNAKNILLKLLHSWSLDKNLSQLFEQPKTVQNTLALNGIKVLTMYWIIINHTYFFGVFYKLKWTFKNLYKLKELPESVSFQLVLNGWPLIETFFFISGLLFINSNLYGIQTSRPKLNIFVLILHRLVRILPSVCGILAINFLWPLFTNGPILIDDEIDAYVTKTCETNWWKNLLLINNFSEPDDICMLITWYLGADFQIYLLAVIILFAFYWNKTFGLLLNGTVLMISIICSALMAYYKDLYPTILTFHIINIDYFNKHLKYGYFPFFQHLAPYCLGIFMGYLLKNKAQIFKITQAKNLIAWICSSLICVSVVLSAYNWNNGIEPTQFISILYNCMYRTVWCIGLSWIIYSCCTGNGGIVERLLSHPIFVPLSRLSYGSYLSQMVVIYIIFFTKKSVTDWSHFEIICDGILTIILSTVLSLILYLLFESPFVNIEKLIVGSNESRYQTKSIITLRDETNTTDSNNNCIYPDKNVSDILQVTKM